MPETAAPSPVRWIELVLLFVGVPLAARAWLPPFMILPLLYAGFAMAMLMLVKDPTFDRRQLGNAGSFARDQGRIVLVFLPCAAGVAAAVSLFAPELLLAFPRERPFIWALVVLLYPLLSVYPQEVIYRALFFHRYAILLPPRALIAASGLLFGYMHLLFQNWIAVALTCIGGVLFAMTYHRTRSALACSFEHALHGAFVFTIGLGSLFYAGNIRP